MRLLWYKLEIDFGFFDPTINCELLEYLKQLCLPCYLT